ncbi:DUF465 domain-containing protein [Vibrio sp. SS-MA-C1-2]|uniref:YdcH family protein n=1 Tax=Vibrio sp. SS-MA-C1-2 TaxID=2908646 RepID=UPI001F3ADA03|nr:DUF465 domain-containing protein [Vibrio sp. SS-MA-C1-2]UJF16850.1 DUF465 domain-containing protein [Vibrio sp. SS-MA-C1-2]
MLHDNHALFIDFPEYKEQITALKTSNRHFQKLAATYDEIDHKIRRLEELGSPIEDAEMETLKVQRVALKDDLLKMIKEA